MHRGRIVSDGNGAGGSFTVRPLSKSFGPWRYPRIAAIKRWTPKTLSWWLAVVGTALAAFPPTRRLAGVLLVTLALGGVGAVYGNAAGVYGVPVQPIPILRALISGRDKDALRSAVAHGAWIAPGLYLLKGRR